MTNNVQVQVLCGCFVCLVLFPSIAFLINLQIILSGRAKHSQRTKLKFSVPRKSSILDWGKRQPLRGPFFYSLMVSSSF